MQIQGQIVDIKNRTIYSGEITVENGKIIAVVKKNHAIKNYILPGFIDAHVHVESSMLVPSEFALLAVLQGTVIQTGCTNNVALWTSNVWKNAVKNSSSSSSLVLRGCFANSNFSQSQVVKL